MQNRYPTLLDQLNKHAEERPDLYRLSYDPVEHHMDSAAIHVYDSTRHAVLTPSLAREKDDYYRTYRQRMMIKERESELAAERRAELRKEEEVKAMIKTPFKFFSLIHTMSGIEQMFKNISKKSSN